MTAIHNTLTGTTTIRQLPTIAGQPHPLPEHYILLQVIDTPAPEYNTALQVATSQYQVDLEALTYTKVWTVRDKTEQELQLEQAQKDWTHTEYQFRIECPKQLGEAYPALYVHFVLNKLPIETSPYNDNIIHIYCSTILPHHSELLNQLGDIVSVSSKPEILINELP